jgi:hypothetical protein
MRRCVIALVALFVLVLAAPAQADPPGRLLPPIDDSGSSVLSNCGFHVLGEFEGKVGALFFEDRVLAFFPGSMGTLTNLETGTEMQVNLGGGPVVESVTFNEDGTVTLEQRLTGNWLHAHPGEPIFHTSGLITETRVFAPREGGGFELVSFEWDTSKARVVDLCEALA